MTIEARRLQRLRSDSGRLIRPSWPPSRPTYNSSVTQESKIVPQLGKQLWIKLFEDPNNAHPRIRKPEPHTDTAISIRDAHGKRICLNLNRNPHRRVERIGHNCRRGPCGHIASATSALWPLTDECGLCINTGRPMPRHTRELLET